MNEERHYERRKANFKRRLIVISNVIKEELDRNQNADAFGLVFKRDTWEMIRLAIAFSRKTNTKKLPLISFGDALSEPVSGERGSSKAEGQ